MGGRALVADEMGVGKTLFALGVIASLKSYPCLIVCPSTIKFIWAEAVEKYLFEQVSLQDVLVVHDSSDMPSLKETPKIVIISYQMLVQLQDIISGIKWVNVICDESHFIHTNSSGKDAQYTELLLRLSREIPFCLLLTGSPLSLSVFDMFNQIDMVCPGALGKTRWEFAVQYCHVFVEPYLRIGKCTRMNEFSSFVRSKCMIRRLKKDVLDLPQKARFLYPVKVSSRSTNRGGNFATKYCASWRRKSEGIMRAVESLLSCHGRLVLFAHHKELIGFLQAQLGSRGILYLTIDGTVPQPDRSRLLDDFSQEKVNVAIVSIKACAVGVSLATATCAVFCELPPNISWMRQAEDRLHRMGQENAVTVYYLFGEGDAFDEEHLKKIQLSHQETRRITEADLLEFCTLPTTVKNRAAERLNNTGCFQAPSLASDHQLLFTVSKNTKRVHVKSVDGSSYWTFSPDEAHDVVHRRSLPLWQQIDQFLANYYRLSSYGRRKLRGTWVSPSNFGESNPKLSPAQSASRSRYTRSLRAGWGFWWKIRRQYGTHFYFCTLRKDGAQYDATCLYCGVSLGNRTRPVPGAVIGKECDVSLFCSGSCRRRFYFQRSSGFIRRSLADDDGGVCARCGVDCKSLYMRLIRTSSPDRQSENRGSVPSGLVEPSEITSANCDKSYSWRVLECRPHNTGLYGRGEARQENMQTLCVVCHAIKTRGEQNHYVSSATSQTVETTVSAGAARMFAVNHQGRAVKLRLTQH
ncbi:hypothetical protein AGDE_02199 [Angomonas deanei]|nr:hypothetical protein AGDE_02199 [Angomonas deanei]|eukprot:EPY41725.1 hypothetical protein AGDE_02199 [Angomonas deanei]